MVPEPGRERVCHLHALWARPLEVAVVAGAAQREPGALDVAALRAAALAQKLK